MENILATFLADISVGPEQFYKKFGVVMGYLSGTLYFFVAIGLIWLSFVQLDTYWKIPYSNLFNIHILV